MFPKLALVVFTSYFLEGQGLPQNDVAANRQVGGISFAIPALNLLGGGNNAGVGGAGLFGTVTFTRTLVSTVTTVTTPSFRTCIAPTAALMPCVPGGPAGRKRRDVNEEDNASEIVETQKIEATPTIQLIIGSTTLSDPSAVTEYLEAHKPSSQSVIYPQDIPTYPNPPEKINPRLNILNSIEQTTLLYPSHDTPETTESENTEAQEIFEDEPVTSTETPVLQDECLVSEETGNGQDDEEMNNDLEDLNEDKARRGLQRTSTVTTVIRVTSVATSLATGPMATLTVSYAGCLPPSLPISGMPCT